MHALAEKEVHTRLYFHPHHSSVDVNRVFPAVMVLVSSYDPHCRQFDYVFSSDSGSNVCNVLHKLDAPLPYEVPGDPMSYKRPFLDKAYQFILCCLSYGSVFAPFALIIKAPKPLFFINFGFILNDFFMKVHWVSIYVTYDLLN